MDREEDKDYAFLEYHKEGLKKQFVPGIQGILMKMDKLANRAIYNEANEGIQYEALLSEFKEIQGQFKFLDNRMTEKQWFDEKLYEFIEKLFAQRFESEKSLSNLQLKSVDLQIAKILEPENLKTVVIDLVRWLTY